MARRNPVLLLAAGVQDGYPVYALVRASHGVQVFDAPVAVVLGDLTRAFSLRGRSMYPLVSDHEIAGLVRSVGSEVTCWRVGVGNMVDSCHLGLEQYCTGRHLLAYNSLGFDGQSPYGGYSQQTVVDKHFVVRIPQAIPLKNAALLLCAGVTVYSPPRYWRAGPCRREYGPCHGLSGHCARARSGQAGGLPTSGSRRVPLRQRGYVSGAL